MRSLWFILIFFTLFASAQDSIFYDSLIVRAEGDFSKIKYKSPVTGAKQTLQIKKGHWNFFDEHGQVIKAVEYSLDRSKKSNVKHGHEVFYDPYEYDTILIRTFNKGKLVNQYAYKEGILVQRSGIICVYKDFDSYSILEYHARFLTGRDFVSMWKSSIEDPDNILKMEEYLLFEDSLGDPSLLEEASFGTKTRYNYVSNAEFEIHPKAPYSMMSFTNQVTDWYPASESPDFYISPDNAHSGGSFVGFRVFTMEKHIEYLQNRLKAPLKKDSIYCFSAYIKLSPGSKYATNSFGVMFSSDPQNIAIEDLHKVEADIQLEDQLLSFKTRWMKIQCTYKAKGGERWMVIGSFKPHQSLELVDVPGTIHESYYYLDDVSLSPVSSEENCPCNFSDQRPQQQDPSINPDMSIEFNALNNLKPGESIVLDDIHFDNDKAELLPSSYSTLLAVLEYLHKNSEVHVEISGHTSNTGEYDHNIDLSQRRALAVKTFLVNNGVKAERIQTEGYGPDQPIADNANEQGQAQNRRVEFKVLKI